MVGYGGLRSRTTPPLGRFSATYLDHSKHSCCAPQKRVRRAKTIFPTTVCCGDMKIMRRSSRLLKNGRVRLTLNRESDSYAAGGGTAGGVRGRVWSSGG